MLDRLPAAILAVVVLLWPIFMLVLGAFVLESISDWNIRRQRRAARRERSGGHAGIYDQATDSPWEPSARECADVYRDFNRRRQQRSAA
jgi:hypothetical protein